MLHGLLPIDVFSKFGKSGTRHNSESGKSGMRHNSVWGEQISPYLENQALNSEI